MTEAFHEPQPPRQSVAERLRDRKARLEPERVEIVLPKTGVAASAPAFIGHGAVQAARRLSKGNEDKFGVTLIQGLCTFDGERLTVEDIEELIDNADIVTLIDKMGVVSSDGEGNG